MDICIEGKRKRSLATQEFGNIIGVTFLDPFPTTTLQEKGSSTNGRSLKVLAN